MISTSNLIHFLVLLPFLGFVLSLVVKRSMENLLSKIAIATLGIHFTSILVCVIYWLFNQHISLDYKDLVIYQSKDYEFFIDFYFDKVTAMYLSVGSFLTFMVTIYSRAYMHREMGYKRFFNTILFFYFGYTITVFAGNLETLFIGWEILGISSFLLIAFYRNRYLPVKNAIKVFSIYRIGDVGLILAMWMSHHLWHKNITFKQLHNQDLVHEVLQNHSAIGIFIALMILITAAAKSAQLPFSSWLPRAMEGPTPSSAIFYGSLSVHLGAFLLLRTYPFWAEQHSVRILIGLIGLSTSLITTGIARVQSSIKSQIAYASISQIGLIFIEIALGFDNLALFHFAGNALLRTYQLLVSPSVVTYLIREQFYNFTPSQNASGHPVSNKLRNTLYVLNLKEWNLETIIFNIWRPFKKTGRSINFLTVESLFMIFIPSLITGLLISLNKSVIPSELVPYVPALFAGIGFILVLKAYTERKHVMMAWVLIIMNHFWIALSVSFNEQFKPLEILFYLSGILVCGTIGFVLIKYLKNREDHVTLNRFQGYVVTYPKLAFAFFICCLGITGFPITATFIGEDLLFSHIHQNQILLAFFASTSLILDGIAAVRIFSRLFLGPTKGITNFSNFNN